MAPITANSPCNSNSPADRYSDYEMTGKAVDGSGRIADKEFGSKTFRCGKEFHIDIASPFSFTQFTWHGGGCVPTKGGTAILSDSHPCRGRCTQHCSGVGPPFTRFPTVA